MSCFRLRLRPGDNAQLPACKTFFSSHAHDFLAYKFVQVREITGRNLRSVPGISLSRVERAA